MGVHSSAPIGVYESIEILRGGDAPFVLEGERRVPKEVFHKVMQGSPMGRARVAAKAGQLAHRVADVEADPCCEELELHDIGAVVRCERFALLRAVVL